jgi:hypothetical protein
MSRPVPKSTKRCAVCGRFRAYLDDDRFCIGCGHDGLESSCVCGRSYDYALLEDVTANLHCPQCGRSLRGRSPEFDG